MPKPTKPATTKALRDKWGKDLLETGWTGLPNVLIEKQHALGLDVIDLGIILHLVKHWWSAAEPPFPSKRRIAQAMGISERTVQRHIAAMEGKGYVAREQRRLGGGRPNRYHLDGLVAELKPFAEEANQEKQERIRSRAARLRRTKPLLQMIK